MLRRAAFLTLALVLVGTGGCRSKRSRAGEREMVEVSVTNNNVLDITVYAVGESGNPRVRLGTVSTSSTERFEFPLNAVTGSGQFRLLADPVGSRGIFFSEVVHVFSGQTVVWTLMPSLRQSVLTIRS